MGKFGPKPISYYVGGPFRAPNRRKTAVFRPISRFSDQFGDSLAARPLCVWHFPRCQAQFRLGRPITAERERCLIKLHMAALQLYEALIGPLVLENPAGFRGIPAATSAARDKLIGPYGPSFPLPAIPCGHGDPRGKSAQFWAIFLPLRRKVQGEWGGSAHSPDPTAQSVAAASPATAIVARAVSGHRSRSSGGRGCEVERSCDVATLLGKFSSCLEGVCALPPGRRARPRLQRRPRMLRSPLTPCRKLVCEHSRREERGSARRSSRQAVVGVDGNSYRWRTNPLSVPCRYLADLATISRPSPNDDQR